MSLWAENFLYIILFMAIPVEACVAERLTTRTPDLEVRGSSPARRAVSLNKEFYSPLFLYTQVYKWVPATFCWRVTLRRTSIPSRGIAILVGMLYALCLRHRDKFRSFGLWLLCAFTFTCRGHGHSICYFCLTKGHPLLEILIPRLLC